MIKQKESKRGTPKVKIVIKKITIKRDKRSEKHYFYAHYFIHKILV